jgi:hypothetical protein
MGHGYPMLQARWQPLDFVLVHREGVSRLRKSDCEAYVSETSRLDLGEFDHAVEC